MERAKLTVRWWGSNFLSNLVCLLSFNVFYLPSHNIETEVPVLDSATPIFPLTHSHYDPSPFEHSVHDPSLLLLSDHAPAPR